MDDFSSLAVEKCLLEPLSSIFCTKNIEALDDDLVRIVAAEGNNSRMERKRLNKKLSILQRSLSQLHRLKRYNLAGKCYIKLVTTRGRNYDSDQKTGPNRPGDALNSDGSELGDQEERNQDSPAGSEMQSQSLVEETTRPPPVFLRSHKVDEEPEPELTPEEDPAPEEAPEIKEAPKIEEAPAFEEEPAFEAYEMKTAETDLWGIGVLKKDKKDKKKKRHPGGISWE